jgi:hypothetical protein
MDSIRRAKLDIPPELILVGGLENLILLSFSTAGHFSLVAILPPTEWSALRAAQLFSLRDFIRFNDLPTKCTTYVYTKFRIG